VALIFADYFIFPRFIDTVSAESVAITVEITTPRTTAPNITFRVTVMMVMMSLVSKGRCCA